MKPQNPKRLSLNMNFTRNLHFETIKIQLENINSKMQFLIKKKKREKNTHHYHH